MNDLKNDTSPIHGLESNKNKFSTQSFLIILFLAVFAGVLIGYFLPSLSGNSQSTSQTDSSQKTAGVDKKTFKDKAEGTLKEGGIDGEGNFHLQRAGGESQNVYLTSSTVDLSQYVGKKVRVWGETFQSEKAGWLMDVGLVEVLQ